MSIDYKASHRMAQARAEDPPVIAQVRLMLKGYLAEAHRHEALLDTEHGLLLLVQSRCEGLDEAQRDALYELLRFSFSAQLLALGSVVYNLTSRLGPYTPN